jgi:hypothetical protein
MNRPMPDVNIRATSVADWLRQRRRLQAQDRRSARLAELHHIDAVIAEAERIVLTGWTQHTWYAGGDGPQCPFDRACLVGAIVHANGGPAAARSQLTRRTLRLTWHTLFRPDRHIVAWCSPPDRQADELRDLTQWNDAPSRRAGEVVDLLGATRAAARGLYIPN